MDTGCLHRGVYVPRIDFHSKGEFHVYCSNYSNIIKIAYHKVTSVMSVKSFVMYIIHNAHIMLFDRW